MPRTERPSACCALSVGLALALAACGGSALDEGALTGGAAGQGGADGGLTGTPPTYAIVDTSQRVCYDGNAAADCPAAGEAFFGQDAQYLGWHPRYIVHGDGTVTDEVTGLMWQQDPGDKLSYQEAVAGAATSTLAGYDDWRVPTIAELYSLILFSGEDPSVQQSTSTAGLDPFIDDSVFGFRYGDPTDGERIIDAQWVTSSVYQSTVMGGERCFFGVNFADGRIKCYPTERPDKGYFAIYVRGGAGYGVNDLTDQGDGTVADAATGLTWQRDDGGEAMTWQEALRYCEGLSLGGHDNWRLPNAKELQSIVDYDRSPDGTGSAAIDPVFGIATITNEAGEPDWPWFWSSTTHADADGGGHAAAYVAFGRALGFWDGRWQDVHGAGAQRSDPKAGDPDDYPEGHGPQGDAIRIRNHVRCVRAMALPATDTGGAGGAGAGGAGTGGAGPTPTGPTPCAEQADCEVPGACPDDASLGCSCEPLREGSACIPRCATVADCPAPPPNLTFTCNAAGLCVPASG